MATFEITDGPSAMGLMFALFDREGNARPLRFGANLQPGQGGELMVWLEGLTHPPFERAIGHEYFHTWEFTGKMTNDSTIHSNRRCKGLFRDDNRTGHLEIISNCPVCVGYTSAHTIAVAGMPPSFLWEGVCSEHRRAIVDQRIDV